ncbi:MAG TPA: Lar family restriction alleviation protein [Thermoanaerobaculia bacterium]|jgi:hypothetical protein|nr:Lar family restriction alleviation protein [Thermoanaerobaculia bacterium]
MAELIAQLDGPVYVERVALYDGKQRTRAKKAIKKAVQLQVENRGFAFVEVLAECPTHLGMSSEESERWVKEEMTKVFPLGVKKDVTVEPLPAEPFPTFDPDPAGHARDHATARRHLLARSKFSAVLCLRIGRCCAARSLRFYMGPLAAAKGVSRREESLPMTLPISPCPKCGRKDSIEHQSDTDGSFRLVCMDCEWNEVIAWQPDESAAIEAWNKRATLSLTGSRSQG